jgi:solute:Na+ symporter, SSS family
VAVSLATKPKPEVQLSGLVMGFTQIPKESGAGIFVKPVFWGAVSIGALLLIQWIFW